MNSLDALFHVDESAWIDSLPTYQRNIVTALLKEGNSPENVAVEWLSATGPANTFTFGTENTRSVFYEKLVVEIEAFICGSEKYTEERDKLLNHVELGQVFAVSTLSAAIAPIVGAAAPLIVPPVALTLVIISQIGRNAWCAMRQEKKKTSQETEEEQ